MRFRHLITALFCLSATLVRGQTSPLSRQEDIADVINRLRPGGYKLAHPALETTVWKNGQRTIITLYDYDDATDATNFNKIEGHLYREVAPGIYRDIAFGPIKEDGGYPEVLSVFFANADADASKELIVLCKYPQQHYDYEGNFYETFIFDSPGQKAQLFPLEKVGEKFYGCECNWRNGKTEVAQYKTAAAVKAGLKRMGF